MERAGFIMAMMAGFFSVFLIGWHGYNGYSADWIYGFMAVFWSLIMMLRLMTLTTPAEKVESTETLPQKLLHSFRAAQEENRQAILESSFGGSFVLFLVAAFLFAGWQVFCAAFPSDDAAFDSFNMLVGQFFAQGDLPYAPSRTRLFDWGQGFLLLLSLSMMGFVLRSHAAEKGMTRAMLIVLCGYAVSGFIAFSGLQVTNTAMPSAAGLVGNGSGSAAHLLGDIAAPSRPSFFDYVLMESGIAGLAILTFLLFIPLGYICLCAQNTRSDKLVVVCGAITGSMMIFSFFLPFTPALGGFIALCWMALFLAWGASENTLRTAKA